MNQCLLLILFKLSFTDIIVRVTFILQLLEVFFAEI